MGAVLLQWRSISRWPILHWSCPVSFNIYPVYYKFTVLHDYDAGMSNILESTLN